MIANLHVPKSKHYFLLMFCITHFNFSNIADFTIWLVGYGTLSRKIEMVVFCNKMYNLFGPVPFILTLEIGYFIITLIHSGKVFL